MAAAAFCAASPGRPKQGPTKGRAEAPSWPWEGRSSYSTSGVST